MINSKTGMISGVRYFIERKNDTHSLTGFFLNGMYYLDPELLTSIGWLDGQQFVCEEFDIPSGHQAFPDRVVGTIENLTLTLESGEPLQLIVLESDLIGD
jgi:hypothetical protein